jgi:predicted acyltransferase
VSEPSETGTLGNPSLGGLTDDQPIVKHGPVQGSVGIARAPVQSTDNPEVEERSDAAPIGALPAAPTVAPAAPVEPATVAETTTTAPATTRASSLDALRGLFLVVMTLGFTIHGRYFPDWMYHRQFPPPGDFVAIAGLTWRDLAYAAFLFTMAAALPITLSRRIDRGETEVSIFVAILRRFALLFLFALLIGHANTYFIGYTQEARGIALLGFAIMFIAFTRRPPAWSATRFRILNRAGWVAAVVFLLLSPYAYASTFSPERRDDIIAGLAFAALSGSVVWYLTRNNLNARLAILAAAVALHLGARSEGWIQDWWWSSPAPWLMRPSSLSLLAVVIPGTIAGDLLLRWMRSGAPRREISWSQFRLGALSLLCIATVPLAVAGLYNRWTLLTTQLVAAICIGGALLTLKPQSESEKLVRQLFIWGSLWLLLGLFLEPAEGGIRKVPETLSYLFTVTGLTTMILVALAIVVDIMGRRGWSRPLIEVGQNPMLAYVLYTVFLNSLLELIPPLRGILRASPGEAMLRSVIMVVLVVVIVQAFTRRKVFWRT